MNGPAARSSRNGPEGRLEGAGTWLLTDPGYAEKGAIYVRSIRCSPDGLVDAGSAAAQETTGAISGRIEDPQRLSVINATVTMAGPQGVRMLVTDAEGRFTAPFLVPGWYTVRAEHQGFKAAEARNIGVSLGKTPRK